MVKRPGWIGVVRRHHAALNLTLYHPGGQPALALHHRRPKAPLRLHFKAPIEVFSYGPAGHLTRHVLAAAGAS